MCPFSDKEQYKSYCKSSKGKAKQKKYRSSPNYKAKVEQHKLSFYALKESSPCTDCKQKFPHYIMDFDHVPERGEKRYPIGMLIGSNTLSAPVVQAELAKCDLICANCHKARTYARKTKSTIHDH